MCNLINTHTHIHTHTHTLASTRQLRSQGLVSAQPHRSEGVTGSEEQEGANRIGGGIGDGNEGGGGSGEVNGHGDGDGAGAGTGTGAELNEGAQDENGEGANKNGDPHSFRSHAAPRGCCQARCQALLAP